MPMLYEKNKYQEMINTEMLCEEPDPFLNAYAGASATIKAIRIRPRQDEK